MGARIHTTPLSSLKSKSIISNHLSVPTFKRQQTIVLRKYRCKYPVISVIRLGIVPNVIRNFRSFMIPVKEDGGLAKTHHEMHNSVILAETDVRTCTKNKPIPTISSILMREQLWMLLGNAVWTPSRGIIFIWVRIDCLIVKRMPQCWNDHRRLLLIL